MALRVGELGRIEDDEVEAHAPVAEAAQRREDVGAEPFARRLGQGVAREVGFEPLERVLGGVEREHVLGSAPEAREREAAVEAERVEHAPPLRLGADERPVVHLVEVAARLVAARDVDRPIDAVGAHDDVLLGQHAAQRPGDLLEALENAHSGVGALVDRAARREGGDRVGDRVLPSVHAGGLHLDRHDVGVAVHHEARQAVALSVHPAHGVALFRVPAAFAPPPGGFEAALEERCVDHLGSIEREDAHGDLGRGGVETPPQPVAAPGDDVDDVAVGGFAVRAQDRAGKDPGVATFQGLLASALHLQFDHIE